MWNLTHAHTTHTHTIKSNQIQIIWKSRKVLATFAFIPPKKKLVNLQLGLFVITYIPKIHLVKSQCGTLHIKSPQLHTNINWYYVMPRVHSIFVCPLNACSYQCLTDIFKVWLCLILSWTVLNRYKWTLKAWMLLQDYAWYQQSWPFDPTLSATVCALDFQTWISLSFFLKMPILW